MKNFILGLLVAGVIVGVGFGGYYYGKKQSSQTPVATPSPTAIVSTVSPTTQIVGNDKDTHGCIGSAGYTWCEAKNKCLRIWEEPCTTSTPEDITAIIKQALIKKNNWPTDLELNVTVKTNDGQYASGTAGGGGGGGYFYAAKDNGVWKIVADGNGTISCASLAPYPDYPKTLIPECYDDKTGKTVQR